MNECRRVKKGLRKGGNEEEYVERIERPLVLKEKEVRFYTRDFWMCRPSDVRNGGCSLSD
jgi:hypothetical protein